MTDSAHPTGLTVALLNEAVREIRITLGAKWVRSQVRKEEEAIKQSARASKNRKQTFLYRQPAHPFIAWMLELERRRLSCIAAKKLEPNEVALRVFTLGASLKLARQCRGFDKVVGRLKNSDSFSATAFECEVAASYRQRAWTVEFIEEGRDRTPDLLVTTTTGWQFFVECKCRDQLSERDEAIARTWSQIESSLLRELGPPKKNALILIRALSDPDHSDVPELLNFIFNQLENGGIGQIDETARTITAEPDPTGKYELIVKSLSEPDEEVDFNGLDLKFDDLDRLLISAHIRQDENGRKLARNPIILGFKNTVPSDKISGLMSAFRSARGQIPSTGPGVVWIRVPDNAWRDNPDLYAKQARQLFNGELTPTTNRRVNAVVLMTRFTHGILIDGDNKIAYAPALVVIEHPAPRTPVSPQSAP